MNNYRIDLNLAAALRESLISYLIDFPITTPDHIKLQASTLASLTAASNQLTRVTLVNQLDRCSTLFDGLRSQMLAVERCFALASAFQTFAYQLTLSDLQSGVDSLSQCSSQLSMVRVQSKKER
jgi:hypothetical protein